MTATRPAPSTLNIPTERHVPALDGIRGIAILAVLLSHGVDLLGVLPRFTPGLQPANIVARIFVPMWGGVDLFFALSGFLITGILLRTRERPTYFRSFYARRALRIFPIYYLYLIFALIFTALFVSRHTQIPGLAPQRGLEIFSFFIYLQNWPIFWKSWAGIISIWAAYWSLAVEEQFYMIWPTVIRFLRIEVVFVLCILGFLLGWPERAYMIAHHGYSLGIMQWPFSRLDGLFLGAALAIYRVRAGRPVPKLWAAAMLLAGIGLYARIAIFHGDQLEGSGYQLWTSGVTAFALLAASLIAFAEHRPHWLIRVLTLPPLLVAGRISYGIYIYHLFIYVLLEHELGHFTSVQLREQFHPLGAIAVIGSAIAITFAVAWLSYRFIEAPILRLKRFFPSDPAPV